MQLDLLWVGLTIKCMSMNPEIIKQLIEEGLSGATVIVNGDDGTHFEATIVSEEFVGKTMLQQHQMVYKTLGVRMGTEIHALAMRTLTPEEWQQ